MTVSQGGCGRLLTVQEFQKGLKVTRVVRSWQWSEHGSAVEGQYSFCFRASKCRHALTHATRFAAHQLATHEDQCIASTIHVRKKYSEFVFDGSQFVALLNGFLRAGKKNAAQGQCRDRQTGTLQTAPGTESGT